MESIFTGLTSKVLLALIPTTLGMIAALVLDHYKLMKLEEKTTSLLFEQEQYHAKQQIHEVRLALLEKDAADRSKMVQLLEKLSISNGKLETLLEAVDRRLELLENRH